MTKWDEKKRIFITFHFWSICQLMEIHNVSPRPTWGTILQCFARVHLGFSFLSCFVLERELLGYTFTDPTIMGKGGWQTGVSNTSVQVKMATIFGGREKKKFKDNSRREKKQPHKLWTNKQRVNNGSTWNLDQTIYHHSLKQSLRYICMLTCLHTCAHSQAERDRITSYVLHQQVQVGHVTAAGGL